MKKGLRHNSTYASAIPTTGGAEDLMKKGLRPLSRVEKAYVGLAGQKT